MSTGKKRLSSSMHMSGWSLLPDELLQIISEYLVDCFDLVHARSVCSSWRSTIPFPYSPSYTLPMFDDEISLENKEALWIIEKIPLFLFSRVCTLDAGASAFEYFLGGISQHESEDRMEISSPIQCSVKVKIRGSDPTLVNMLDCQILPLCHQYRMIGWAAKYYKCVAFLPLNEDEGEFVVLVNYEGVLFVTTSAEIKWKRLENVPEEPCTDLVTFRGRFYAFFEGESVVIDPYSLEVTLLEVVTLSEVTLLMLWQDGVLVNYLVPCGDDELFLVEKNLTYSMVRVSRLDEEAGEWVEVSDLGDRVLFLNRSLGNVSCSAKEFPDSCGLSVNSIVFTYEPGSVTYISKYGNSWKILKDKSVKILSTSPALALRVEHAR